VDVVDDEDVFVHSVKNISIYFSSDRDGYPKMIAGKFPYPELNKTESFAY